MFTLRKDHLDAFSASRLRSFEQRMAKRLRSRFSGKLAGTSDRELDNLVRLGMTKSSEYGVVGESDVGRYLEYMAEYSPDFDVSPNTPWARPILTSAKETGSQKMDNLDNFTTFELRD